MKRIKENRNAPGVVEVRAGDGQDGDSTIKIVGHGAVFNSWYDVYGIKERVAPKAFDKTLKENKDIRGMFNHNPDFLLGRTASGTMDVSTDKAGLLYEIRADSQDPQAVSVSRKIERGDVDGSSMAFFVHREEWEEKDGAPTTRTILEVELIETGPVAMPASPATNAAIARSLQNDGFDYEAVLGLAVKQRAGFTLSGVDEALIDRTIRRLESLKSAPDDPKFGLDHPDIGTSSEPDWTGYGDAAWAMRMRALEALAV